MYQTCITGFRRLLRLPNVVHFLLCQETNQNLHPPEEFPSEKWWKQTTTMTLSVNRPSIFRLAITPDHSATIFGYSQNSRRFWPATSCEWQPSDIEFRAMTRLAEKRRGYYATQAEPHIIRADWVNTDLFCYLTIIGGKESKDFLFLNVYCHSHLTSKHISTNLHLGSPRQFFAADGS